MLIASRPELAKRFPDHVICVSLRATSGNWIVATSHRLRLVGACRVLAMRIGELDMLGKIKALRGSANRWENGDDLHVRAWDGEEPVRIDISIDEWRSLCERFAGDEEAAVAALATLAT